DRAAVAVVARGCRVPDAGAAEAGLEAVAGVAVAAGRAVRDRAVDAAGHRVAGVSGAGVAVVAGEREAGHADPDLTRLGPVADGCVEARRSVQDGGVRAAEDGIAGVRGADIAVVADEGRAGRARAVLAGLRAVADGPVVAGRAVGDVDVPAAEHRVAA